LQEIEWPAHLQLKPLKECIALHTPCTLRNVQQQASAPEMLLKRIPEIKLMNLTQECCGAAGMYMLEHPQMSDALVENTLQHIGDFQPQRIATSNIGCQLHLARALQKRGLAIGVLHPISLIAKQLSDS
jgi:glycolate oxidase iron-sulfur subunit